MPRRGKRRKLARGIWADASGCSVVASVHGRQREIRFPPHTPLKELRAEHAKLSAQNTGRSSRSHARGTLAAAVERWTKLERHLASWKERHAELKAWVARYGNRRLRAITEHDIRETIGAWTEAGVAPKTIRNRLWSLRHLYKLTLGKHTDTPADDVEPPAIPRRIIIPTLPSIVLTVYRNLIAMEQRKIPVKGAGVLRDAKTRARFMVLAATGRRPCEVMRAEPDDVDLGLRIWRVRDAKGGWSEGLYLNDDMLVAWTTFVTAKAWGDYNTGSMSRVLRACGWPAGVRVYNLRHSTGIALSERGIDLADVSGWLGHSRVQTTRSAYVPVLGSRMQRAAEQLDGRFGGWILVPETGTPEPSKP